MTQDTLNTTNKTPTHQYISYLKPPTQLNKKKVDSRNIMMSIENS